MFREDMLPHSRRLSEETRRRSPSASGQHAAAMGIVATTQAQRMARSLVNGFVFVLCCIVLYFVLCTVASDWFGLVLVLTFFLLRGGAGGGFHNFCFFVFFLLSPGGSNAQKSKRFWVETGSLRGSVVFYFYTLLIVVYFNPSKYNLIK